MPVILLQSLEKSPQFTNHLSSMYPNVNTQLQILKWWVTLRSALYLSFFVRPLPITLNKQYQVPNRRNTQRDSSLLQRTLPFVTNITPERILSARFSPSLPPPQLSLASFPPPGYVLPPPPPPLSHRVIPTDRRPCRYRLRSRPRRPRRGGS